MQHATRISLIVWYNLALNHEEAIFMIFSFTYIYRYALAALIFGGSNLLLVLLSVSLCAFIAPEAAGSGIPEVKAYLNGVDAPNVLSPKTLIVKVFSTMIVAKKCQL